MRKLTFYKDKKGEHRWRLKAGNKKIILASSEGFSSKQNAEKNFISIVKVMVEFTYDTVKKIS